MQSTSERSSLSYHNDRLVAFKQSTLHRRVNVTNDDGDDDHLVQDAVELVAAAHVADRHEVGTDHAGQLGAWVRLADHAQAAQSKQSILHGGGGDHVDSPHRSTSMKMELDSVIDSSGKTYLAVRRGRAVTGREVATSASAVGRRQVVLRFVHAPSYQAPYKNKIELRCC